MQSVVKNLTRQIKRAQKPITILFTDIEGSTSYWEKHGDIEGRLMIDRHNRLMFPIIRHFDGKVIKTIGDSIMASFKYPEDAVNAAAGMQQFLTKARQTHDMFVPIIRIGIHTGEGIVENSDVFGDVVNVASRVESKAKGGEILASSKTVSAIDRIKRHQLTRKGKFTPKGKSESIKLYRCNWRDYADLTGEVKVDTLSLLVGQQKWSVFLYATVIFGTLYFMFNKYLRFFMADNQEYALVFLNPKTFFNTYGLGLAGIAVVIVAGLIFLARNERLSHLIMRLGRGGFGFCTAFFLFYIATQLWSPNLDKYWNETLQKSTQLWSPKLDMHWNEILHESAHLFVEVLEDGSPIYQHSRTSSSLLKRVNKGTLLLLADTAKHNGYIWNKVLIDQEQYGWIQRVTPARLGVAPERLTIANKFYFAYQDLYAVLFGLLGFIWGMLSFRIRPS